MGLVLGTSTWAICGAFSITLACAYLYYKNSFQPTKTLPKSIPPPKRAPYPDYEPLDTSLEGLIKDMERTRNLPVNKLPVAVDIPRLGRKTDIYDGENLLVQGGADRYDSPDDENELFKRRVDLMYDIWITIARLVNEDPTVIDQHLRSYLDNGEIGLYLGNFIRDHCSDDNKVIKLLKVCNQSILASAVLRMKQVVGNDWPYKDLRGGWNVIIKREGNTISVTHSKQEQSWETSNKYAEQHFSFVWDFRIVFDLNVDKMVDASITISKMDFVETVPLDTRKKIIACFLQCSCLRVSDELMEYVE